MGNKFPHQDDRMWQPAWIADGEIQEKRADQERRRGTAKNLRIHKDNFYE